MDRVNLGPLHDATQDRNNVGSGEPSNVIPFLRREVAEVREGASFGHHHRGPLADGSAPTQAGRSPRWVTF
jgi:hypothetical protein